MGVLGDVLSKATRQADPSRSEVLAEQGLATATIETLVALEGRRTVRVSHSVETNFTLTVIPTSATQRSPFWKPWTSLPTSTATPTASWPGMSYDGRGRVCVANVMEAVRLTGN
jgi:hypothetical protein